MNDPTDPIWSVIFILGIGLLGTLWWIYDILKLAYKEQDVSVQNKEHQKNS